MEWNIQSRAHACQSCKTAFQDKETFHTMLFDQKNGYERFDVCQNCWTTQFSQGALDRKGFISYWQSIYNVPPPAPPEAIQKENAESLLRRLAEANDAKYAPALYIVAAMLERKRILKVKAQLSRNGRRLFVYEHAKSGDIFQIEDPNLQLHQLESVQHEVLHLLQHGFPEDAPPETVEPKSSGDEASPANSQETSNEESFRVVGTAGMV